MEITENIITTSIASQLWKASPVMLEETPTTRLCFEPRVSDKGIGGNLIRYKKAKNNCWEISKKEDFRKLQLNEGVFLDLNTSVLTKLLIICEDLLNIKDNGYLKYGQQTHPSTIKNTDGLDIGFSNRTLELIWKHMEDNNEYILLDKLTEGHKQLQRKRVIEELENRLQENFLETSGDNNWQAWIYKNNWLFGANYKEPLEKQKINLGGCMPDYLFPTVDGFVDILEIKLPTHDVIKQDSSHRGSWIWSKDTNKAIGQVVNYLGEIERLRLEIEKNILSAKQGSVSILKPRAYILIGQSIQWEQDQKEGLRKLNGALHGIEVITYTDLLNRGKSFIS